MSLSSQIDEILRFTWWQSCVIDMDYALAAAPLALSTTTTTPNKFCLGGIQADAPQRVSQYSLVTTLHTSLLRNFNWIWINYYGLAYLWELLPILWPVAVFQSSWVLGWCPSNILSTGIYSPEFRTRFAWFSNPLTYPQRSSVHGSRSSLCLVAYRGIAKAHHQSNRGQRRCSNEVYCSSPFPCLSIDCIGPSRRRRLSIDKVELDNLLIALTQRQ